MRKSQMGKSRIGDVADTTSFKMVEPSTLKKERCINN